MSVQMTNVITITASQVPAFILLQALFCMAICLFGALQYRPGLRTLPAYPIYSTNWAG